MIDTCTHFKMLVFDMQDFTKTSNRRRLILFISWDPLSTGNVESLSCPLTATVNLLFHSTVNLLFHCMKTDGVLSLLGP